MKIPGFTAGAALIDTNSLAFGRFPNLKPNHCKHSFSLEGKKAKKTKKQKNPQNPQKTKQNNPQSYRPPDTLPKKTTTKKKYDIHFSTWFDKNTAFAMFVLDNYFFFA